MENIKNYDIAILGAGPAGLTAGLYAGRGGLKAAIIEKMMPGGLVANTERIDNYPGFPEGVGGADRLAGALIGARNGEPAMS